MSEQFINEITQLYIKAGDHYILPFIGDSYSKDNSFRVVAVGINIYVEEQHVLDEGVPSKKRWFHYFWQQAGHGNSQKFYEAAYKELVSILPSIRDKVWPDLLFDLKPKSKGWLYATNTIKIYTGKNYKKSNDIPKEYIDTFSATWEKELDLMGRYKCLPHVIIIFGNQIWETHWRSLVVDSNISDVYVVIEFSGVRDHVHKVVLAHSNGNEFHTLFLIRLYHPSAQVSKAKRQLARDLPLQFIDNLMSGVK